MSTSFLVVGFGFVNCSVDTSAEPLELCQIVGNSPGIVFNQIEDIVSVDNEMQVK